MAMGLETNTSQLSLGRFIEMIGGGLPAVVFSDEQVTKMHNSLPLALVHFEVLLKLDESREFAWVTCFFA
jgi:hypothetical protein